MKNNTNIIALYNLNALLVQRIKRYSWFYGVVVGLATIFVFTFAAISFFTDVIDFIDAYGIQSINNYLVYCLVMADVLFVCLRFSSETIIEPHHLAIFPMSIPKKLLWNLSIMFFDYRGIPYITLAALICLDRMLHFQVAAAFMSLVFIMVLYLNITIWMYVLFFSSGSLIGKYRSQAVMLLFPFSFFYSASLLYHNGLLMNLVPLTSYTGTGVFLISTGEFFRSLLFLFLLVTDAILGFLVLIVNFRKQ